MGGSERRGRWRLAERCRVISVIGSSDLDLTDVELAGEQVTRTVFSLMGGASITVPESLNVEVSKLALLVATMSTSAAGRAIRPVRCSACVCWPSWAAPRSVGPAVRPGGVAGAGPESAGGRAPARHARPLTCRRGRGRAQAA